MGTVVPLQRGLELRARKALDQTEPRYDTKALARLLDVSPSTLKRWRGEGMPYEVWGTRSYRYLLSQVLAWRDRRG